MPRKKKNENKNIPQDMPQEIYVGKVEEPDGSYYVADTDIGTFEAEQIIGIYKLCEIRKVVRKTITELVLV